MNKALDRIALPEGYRFEIFNAHQPIAASRYAM
jgi:hypothetical protein